MRTQIEKFVIASVSALNVSSSERTGILVLTITLCLLMSAGTSYGQLAPLIANVNGRQVTSLDGDWRAIVDPFNTGAIDYHSQPLKNNNAFFKNHKPASKSELVEYDFDTSGTLAVPGDWNTQRESLLFYEGSVWYKRSFDYPKAEGKRLFLHFGAANHVASVYLNGSALGVHEGGFTPFDFEITDLVKAKDNFLIVRVDDVRRKDQVPTDNSDWWNYGGITRPVSLVEVPQTFIQDYFVQLEKGSARQVKGWLQLNGAKLQQTVTIRIPEAGVAKKFQTDGKGRAEFSFPVELKLWSPENPKLYQVEVSVETDKIIDRIGFRALEVHGTDLLLNGKPVFFRGINLHEEAPSRPGRAWSEDDARILLGWAKELGCNFVRLAHYPHSEAMLRVADEMGIMVWEEVPVYWAIEWENPQTLRSAQSQLRELIARDHNRVSLVIYSVANETPIGDARNRFLRTLIQDIHSTDPTRLVSAALQPKQQQEGAGITMRITDPVADDLDVVGINQYVGWYTGLPEDADKITWISNNKPLIMSEFGADALSGAHGDVAARWTEEYQENLYNHQIAMLKRISFLRGVTPWVLKDFRSPRRTLPHYEDYFNRKGLISTQGEKKKAFFVLQKYYGELSESGRIDPPK
jgi:beta-glucuronidase